MRLKQYARKLRAEWRDAWTDPAKARFSRRAVIGAIAVTLTGTLVGNTFAHEYRIGLDLGKVRCLPWRVYLLHLGRPAQFSRGDYVAFVPRNQVMGPWFEGRLVGKQVGAVAGDMVEIHNDYAWVNGKPIGKLDLIDRLHRKSGDFDRVERVPPGTIFVLGTEPRSYDSRYWGVLDQSYVVGSVRPLL